MLCFYEFDLTATLRRGSSTIQESAYGLEERQEDMQPVNNLLTGLIPQLPVLIVMLAGILIGLVRWRKHPGISLLAVLGFVLLIVVLLANNFNSENFLLLLHTRLGMAFNRIAVVQVIVNMVLAFLRTVAWVLLVTAIFARRPEKA